MIVVSGIIAIVGVVATLAVILILSVLAERWVPGDEPRPSVEEQEHERPLVRIIKPHAGRGQAA
jgi:hypothetical protein